LEKKIKNTKRILKSVSLFLKTVIRGKMVNLGGTEEELEVREKAPNLFRHFYGVEYSSSSPYI